LSWVFEPRSARCCGGVSVQAPGVRPQRRGAASPVVASVSVSVAVAVEFEVEVEVEVVVVAVALVEVSPVELELAALATVDAAPLGSPPVDAADPLAEAASSLPVSTKQAPAITSAGASAKGRRGTARR